MKNLLKLFFFEIQFSINNEGLLGSNFSVSTQNLSLLRSKIFSSAQVALSHLNNRNLHVSSSSENHQFKSSGDKDRRIASADSFDLPIHHRVELRNEFSVGTSTSPRFEEATENISVHAKLIEISLKLILS